MIGVGHRARDVRDLARHHGQPHPDEPFIRVAPGPQLVQHDPQLGPSVPGERGRTAAPLPVGNGSTSAIRALGVRA
ncbi:hypothetical protein [Nonomuraea sp. KM88]|uniref:hypothetical protein n=1 Tax=Nonomuraea sp. KM88 TaxID=3457427 RepID=UPI003FCC373C